MAARRERERMCLRAWRHQRLDLENDEATLFKSAALGVEKVAHRSMVVDLNKLLAAPRTGAHTVAPTYNLVTNGVLTFVSVH